MLLQIAACLLILPLQNVIVPGLIGFLQTREGTRGRHRMKSRTGTQRLKVIGRLLGAVMLFVLYGMGSTQTDYLHQLFHPDEIAAAHTPVEEEDPCHRAIYHGVDTACEHEYHVVKLSSCSCFHTLTHSDPLLFNTPFCSGVEALTSCVLYISQDHSGSYYGNLFLRGPPAPYVSVS